MCRCKIGPKLHSGTAGAEQHSPSPQTRKRTRGGPPDCRGNPSPKNMRLDLREVPRWGCSVSAKNQQYTAGAHHSLISDVPRLAAFTEALERAAPGRRVLDVGTGPFMVLARIAQRCGASFVACVEHSSRSVTLALEILKREARSEAPSRRSKDGWTVVDGALDEECSQFLGQLAFLGAQLDDFELACPAPVGQPGVSAGCVALATGARDGRTIALYQGLSSTTALPGQIEVRDER